MRTFLLKLYLLALLPTLTQATEQLPDQVTIGKGLFNFYNYPLEQLISKERFREIYEIEELCSAAWRGYKGLWEIRDGVLYLSALLKDPCGYDSVRKSYFDSMKLIPEFNVRKGGHKATWYTGEVVIPISEERVVPGKKNKSGHSYFEHQVIVYSIKTGIVQSREIVYRER